MKVSIRSTSAGNGLSQFVSMVDLLGSRVARLVRSVCLYGLLSSDGFRGSLVRSLLKGRRFYRNVQVEGSVSLLTDQRSYRRFHSRSFIYHVPLAVLSNTSMTKEGRRSTLLPRRLHGVVVRVAHFVDVVRRRGRNTLRLDLRQARRRQNEETRRSLGGSEVG